MACLVAIVLMFASIPLGIYLADVAFRDSHRSMTVTSVKIEFGTGGAGCSLATTATTFSTRDRIRMVGTSRPAGKLLSIHLLQYGRLLALFPVTSSDPTSGCVDDDLPSLPVGHYEVRICEAAGPVAPSLAVGEFDVTSWASQPGPAPEQGSGDRYRAWRPEGAPAGV
jgi:hypothetical protein